MNRIILLILYFFVTSCSSHSTKSELIDFTYSICIDSLTNSEFTPPRLVKIDSQQDKVIVKVIASANCGADLKGKIDIIGKQILIYYTIDGLDYDNYAPKPPPEPIVQTPEPIEIDSYDIKEVFINLCYCKYTLTYTINNPPIGFKISSVNKWEIE